MDNCTLSHRSWVGSSLSSHLRLDQFCVDPSLRLLSRLLALVPSKRACYPGSVILGKGTSELKTVVLRKSWNLLQPNKYLRKDK